MPPSVCIHLPIWLCLNHRDINEEVHELKEHREREGVRGRGGEREGEEEGRERERERKRGERERERERGREKGRERWREGRERERG